MAADKTLFVKLYINRLVNTLVPSEFGSEYTQSLVSDLLAHLESQSSAGQPSLPDLLEKIKRQLSIDGRTKEWIQFQSIVDVLTQLRLLPQIAAYLEFLLELAPEGRKQPSLHIQSNPLSASKPYSSPHTGGQRALNTDHLPMSKLIEPVYETLEESVIISNLQFTLLGQDTKLLPISVEPIGVEIPANINISYSRLLADILEPALLYKRLSIFLGDVKGKEPSPIKTAFLRFLDSYLSQYVRAINDLFLSTPKTLLSIFNALQSEIQILRLMGNIQSQYVKLLGFEFLMTVYNLSQFGDVLISQYATQLFHVIVVPYYEYIEHWVIKGDLIDDNDEFFISFDVSQNHINDIIRYNAKKLPTFMNLDESLYKKIFEIGKTIVFLAKYCQELEWVNNYSVRYSAFVFRTHGGLKSMKTSAIHDLLNVQYEEVLDHFTVVMQSKFSLLPHLQNMKRIMLTEASDFIETLSEKGFALFSEPASALTSGFLSELLIDSEDASSIRFMPLEFKHRIDARLLDMSHGTVGWDVFTLEYKTAEPSLEAILNYNDQSTQYLRIFNFLWGFKHFQSLLLKNFTDFQDLHKTDLHFLRKRYRAKKDGRKSALAERVEWFNKAVRTINLIRSKLLKFVQVILKYLSFDLIEENFEHHILRRLFQSKNVMDLKSNDNSSNGFKTLPILNKNFAQQCNQEEGITGLEKVPQIKYNVHQCTIEQLTTIHSIYLSKISDCKLLSEVHQGRHSGISFINQIFEFLEISFAFVKSSEEFNSSLSNYISLLKYNSSAEDFDDDMEELYQRLVTVMKIIYKNLYIGRFERGMDVFLRDLRADVDLKDLSKLL